jgi:hypothetical protein
MHKRLNASATKNSSQVLIGPADKPSVAERKRGKGRGGRESEAKGGEGEKARQREGRERQDDGIDGSFLATATVTF